MKKTGKIVSGLLCVAVSLFTFTACPKEDPEEVVCEHEFTWYTVADATCTEKGVMEGLCGICGEKEYLDVEAKGHKLINGVCKVCGQEEEQEQEPLASDIGWTMEEIFQKASVFGVTPKLEDYKDCALENPYVNKWGKLCYTAQDGETKYDLTLFDVRDDFSVESSQTLYAITKLEIKNCTLWVTTSDGEKHSYGDVGAFYASAASEENIEKIAVNKDNVAVIIYKNGKWKIIGKLVSDKSEVRKAPFVYEKRVDKYVLANYLGEEDTLVRIPYSHKGTAITQIGEYAFRGHEEVVSLIIPRSINFISSWAFENCDNLKNIFYEGLESEWTSLLASSGANLDLSGIKVYYYTETQPLLSNVYWRYDTDGESVLVW